MQVNTAAVCTIAHTVREEMEQIYGSNLSGHCIEASKKIAALVSAQLGLDAITKEGWCRYDEESYGSDHPWDPHTWVEIPALNLYIDVTADQFNYGMYEDNQFPPILVQSGLPSNMQYEEPTWDDCEQESGAFYMEDRILFEIEDSLRALNHALDALNRAEDRAGQLHPSIGNQITTAKLIVTEVMNTLLQEKEQNQVPGISAAHIGWQPLYSKIANEIELTGEDDLVALAGYGNFPTLAEIQRDYQGLMDLIKDVKTPEQAKALADAKDLIVEVNGDRVDDFLADPSNSDLEIDWIRYEAFGCLHYIYDRFDGQPMFDVWSNVMNREFITDVTIGGLTEKRYEELVKAEIELLVKLGEVSQEQVDSLIAKSAVNKLSLDDQIQSAADKAVSGANHDAPAMKMVPMPGTTTPDWGQKHWGSDR